MAKKKTSNDNDSPVSVRLGPVRKARSEALCAELDIPMTTLIKWALDGLDQYYESAGGRVLLPLNFGDLRSLIEMEMRKDDSK